MKNELNTSAMKVLGLLRDGRECHMISQTIEQVVREVARLDEGHGYWPKGSLEVNKRYAEAMDAGVILPKRGSWGHQLTIAGRKVMAEINAREQAHHDDLRAAGFDPKKRISDMTDTEIAAFKAWMHRGKS